MTADSEVTTTLVACRLTVSYLLVYSSAIVLQVVTKKRLLRRSSSRSHHHHHPQQKKEQKEHPFDRYQNLEMLAADRAVGNLLEWTPIYLGLVWVLAALDGLGGASTSTTTSSATTWWSLQAACYHAAWGYIGTRILYLLLIYTKGISLDGKQSSLYAATYPAYACLIILLVQAVKLLIE